MNYQTADSIHGHTVNDIRGHVHPERAIGDLVQSLPGGLPTPADLSLLRPTPIDRRSELAPPIMLDPTTVRFLQVDAILLRRSDSQARVN